MDASDEVDHTEEAEGTVGPPRIRIGLTEAGPVEHRPGQVLLDLVVTGVVRPRDDDGGGGEGRRLPKYEPCDEQLADLVERVATEILGERYAFTLDVDEPTIESWLRTGIALVNLIDPPDDLPRFLMLRNRAARGSATPPLGLNLVYRVASLTADPMRFAGALTADPMRFASAFGADPMRFANSSTARPAATPDSLLDPRARRGGRRTSGMVAILDTRFPEGDIAPNAGRRAPRRGDRVAYRGDDGNQVVEIADENRDGYLDIAAGHLTFIRSIVERASPGTPIVARGVLRNDGDGDELVVASALQSIADDPDIPADRLVLNLSFSGYYDEDDPAFVGIRRVIDELDEAGAVLVAAAGNDGSCRPKLPAALPNVLAVSSLGECGPAPFSNHGRWVDVAAPGVDLVGRFFPDFDGLFFDLPDAPELALPSGLEMPDLDDFEGWAMWSGTSFSTAIVVGALAATMQRYRCTAREARRIVVERRGLYRIPDYGVVVNHVY